MVAMSEVFLIMVLATLQGFPKYDTLGKLFTACSCVIRLNHFI